MKYYRLQLSGKLSEIGIFPQVNKGVFVSTWDSDKSILKVFLRPIDDEKIEIPELILNDNAKWTDMISVSFVDFKLVISSKLKEIIHSSNYSGIQFFKTSIHIVSNIQKDLWLLNPFETRNEYIDFENSIIKCGVNYDFTYCKVSSNYELKELISKGRNENRNYIIDKIALKPNIIKEDFFILDNVAGGICYVVSESLKTRIENAGCTGIEYVTL